MGAPQRGAAQTTTPPTIHNVTVHKGAGVLTITGTGFGQDPVVTMAGTEARRTPGHTDRTIPSAEGFYRC